MQWDAIPFKRPPPPCGGAHDMEGSAENDACHPGGAPPHNPTGETIRRRQVSRSMNTRAFSCGFEDKSTANMRMRFRDTQQSFVVFSISHVGMPPLALKPDLASLRVYACFNDVELATHHAVMCSQLDASCNFQVGPMHEWIVASRDAESHSNREETQEHLLRIMNNHLAEVAGDREQYEERRRVAQDAWGSWDPQGTSREQDASTTEPGGSPEDHTGEVAEDSGEAFAAHLAVGGETEDRAAGLDEGPQEPTDGAPLVPSPRDDPQNPDGSLVLDTSKLDPHMMTASGMCPPHNNLAVVSFVQDEGERNEFAFCVWRIATSDEECDFYVRNVAGERVHEHAFYIARTGEWHAPRHISKDTPVCHRQSELNLIMQSHSQRVSDLEDREESQMA